MISDRAFHANVPKMENRLDSPFAFIHGLRRWLPLALFAVLWVDLIRLLSSQWDAREQYAYGWFVPLFALILLGCRWASRPILAGQVSGRLLGGTRSVVVFVLLVVSGLALLPLRVIYEINQDWPLISWLYTAIVVGVSLYGFYLAGGGVWVRHFAFPVCLILVAVVWPWRLEKPLTQDLMRVVTQITVELLGWLNVPAVAQGNLINLSAGTVGVSEACSGIRSFQSSLMVGLVMGELYRMRLWPRIALVVGGLTLAFGLNIVRTLLLSWEANAHGLEAVSKWHDSAGVTITVVCFLSLWAVAAWLKPKRGTASQREGWPQSSNQGGQEGQRGRSQSGVSHATSPVPMTIPLSKAGQSSATNWHSPAAGSMTPAPRRPAVTWFLALVGLWSLCLLGGTKWWYGAHTLHSWGNFYWSVRFPTNHPNYAAIQLPSRTRELLGYDRGGAGTWLQEDGVEWTVYFFRWNPTSIEHVLKARVHRPERCLPASGLRLLADAGVRDFTADSLHLPFRQYVYEAAGKTLFVFFCQWEDGRENQSGVWGTKQADRIRSVLVGRQMLGQQTVEVILTGPTNLAAAAATLRRHLPALIQREAQLINTHTFRSAPVAQ